MIFATCAIPLFATGCGGNSLDKQAMATARTAMERSGLIVDGPHCKPHPGLESGHGTNWFLCTGAVDNNGQRTYGQVTIACTDNGTCRTND